MDLDQLAVAATEEPKAGQKDSCDDTEAQGVDEETGTLQASFHDHRTGSGQLNADLGLVGSLSIAQISPTASRVSVKKQ